MTTTTALTSYLEAVNTLLDAVKESGINSLGVSGVADVTKARSALDRISRNVQQTGWSFNTEDEYPLPRNQDNQIVLAPNVLKVIPSKSASTDIVQRGQKLYDRENHRDAFEKDLTGTLVFLLPWEELPQAARTYIMVRASRVFQAEVLGSDTQFRFSADEEEDARKALQEAEGETGKFNMFQDSASVSMLVSR